MQPAPVIRSFVVRTRPDAAFRAWTEHTATWWPPGHRISGDPSGRVHMEGGEGGRLFERSFATAWADVEAAFAAHLVAEAG